MTAPGSRPGGEPGGERRTTGEIVADLRMSSIQVILDRIDSVALKQYVKDATERLVELDGAMSRALRHAHVEGLFNGGVSEGNLVVGFLAWIEQTQRELAPAALHACDLPDCPTITYRCAESRTG